MGPKFNKAEQDILDLEKSTVITWHIWPTGQHYTVAVEVIKCLSDRLVMYLILYYNYFK